LLANAFDNPDNRKRTIAICAYVLFSIGKYDAFAPLPEGKTVTDWLNSLNDEELRRQLKLLSTSKQSDGRSEHKPKAVADDLELTLAGSEFHVKPSAHHEDIIEAEICGVLE
jgi:hypothetical protein